MFVDTVIQPNHRPAGSSAGRWARLGGICTLCRFCCQNCSKIHRKKGCKIKLRVSPSTAATHTPRRCQRCHPSLAAAPRFSDAGEGRGQAAGPSTSASAAFGPEDPGLPASPCTMQVRNCFSPCGCCESLPALSSAGVGVCSACSEQAQGLGALQVQGQCTKALPGESPAKGLRQLFADYMTNTSAHCSLPLVTAFPTYVTCCCHRFLFPLSSRFS